MTLSSHITCTQIILSADQGATDHDTGMSSSSLHFHSLCCSFFFYNSDTSSEISKCIECVCL